MSKFAKPFVEIRLYLPLGLDDDDIAQSPLYQALLASALEPLKEGKHDAQ